MANPEHVEVVRKGLDATVEWRKKHQDLSLDLSRAELRGTILCGADLWRADLSNANLRGADLSRADLRGANLSEAVLCGVCFDRVIVGLTSFGNLDLSEARGLDSVRHRAPSSIGIDTIFKSKGKIPESFLRGCGVPDELIVQLPAIIGSIQPIQFYSCFISYSHEDEEFAKRLYGRMRDDRLKVWFAPEDMRMGRKMHDQIDQAIRFHDKLLLALSEHSMNSEWVKSEIRWAKEKERKEGKQALFPIRLVDMDTIQTWKFFDADSGRDLAGEVREYHIGDFSNWKDHDSFEAGYDRLLGDLKEDERIE